jgi:hypothetical protein
METIAENSRLAYVASLFEEICDRTYRGPQGSDLSIFLEEACNLPELRKCNLEMYRTQKTKSNEYKKYFSILRHYDRAEPTVKVRNKHMHSITDILKLTPAGLKLIESSEVYDPVVYKLQLRCGGGSYRGKPSGSNCVRVAYRVGWCTGAGECSELCGWSKTCNFKDRLEHMCNFTVTITATLTDIQAGKRRIKVAGNHGYTNIQDWVPPSRKRPPAHFRERAIKTAMTVRGPSASNLLNFINSPSASKSRSFLPNDTYYKMVENYRRGKLISSIHP